MFKLAKPLFLICETPLHAGSGDALGVVDLPIQRERHTGFPKIEASSLKGAIREAFEGIVSQKLNKGQPTEYIFTDNIMQSKLQSVFPNIIEFLPLNLKGDENAHELEKKVKLTRFNEAISLAFGPEDAGSDGHAGALGFTDARILLFPVKSMKGVFAWITCPRVLKQFYKEISEFCKIAGKITVTDYKSLENTVSNRDHLCIKDHLVLEEYAIEIKNDQKQKNDSTSTLAKELSILLGIDDLKNKLAILPDNVFTDFVQLSTEVISRIKIKNETGTTENLFQEEFLPAESVLYTLVLASPIFQQEDKKGIFKKSNGKEEENLVLNFFKAGLKPVIQVGGNATLGKGIVKTQFIWEENPNV